MHWHPTFFEILDKPIFFWYVLGMSDGRSFFMFLYSPDCLSRIDVSKKIFYGPYHDALIVVKFDFLLNKNRSSSTQTTEWIRLCLHSNPLSGKNILLSIKTFCHFLKELKVLMSSLLNVPTTLSLLYQCNHIQD